MWYNLLYICNKSWKKLYKCQEIKILVHCNSKSFNLIPADLGSIWRGHLFIILPTYYANDYFNIWSLCSKSIKAQEVTFYNFKNYKVLMKIFWYRYTCWVYRFNQCSLNLQAVNHIIKSVSVTLTLFTITSCKVN